MDKIATRITWNNEPIDIPKRMDISLQFTDKQFSKLTRGLIPQEMEDKWFIFCENDWLYFHRSWTGFGIYKTQLIKEQNGYSIKEFWVERNLEKYNNESDNADYETFISLIARGLLGIDVTEIRAGIDMKSETDIIKRWSIFGNLLFANKGVNYTDRIKAALFGVAVGDALGVPVEFKNRQSLQQNPVKEMIGYGTYNLPPGTWSDDSSLTFCLAEALTKDFDLNIIGQNFVKWCSHGYWTPRGNVFDIGNTTKQAIDRLAKGTRADLAGESDESSNGNGSLMRISPLLFYLVDKQMIERYEITRQVSSITHRHVRSVIACFYYLEFAGQILAGEDKFEAYRNLQTAIPSFLDSISVNPTETALFNRLLNENIYELPEEKIFSSGYVLHTLEASIWCLMTTDNFKDAVLKAVNLGEDTDTTGAVTGGIAGLLYGYDNIPTGWINQLARHDDIENLAKRLGEKLASR